MLNEAVIDDKATSYVKSGCIDQDAIFDESVFVAAFRFFTISAKYLNLATQSSCK